MREFQYGWAILVLSGPLLVVARPGGLAASSQEVDSLAEQKQDAEVLELRKRATTTTTLALQSAPTESFSFKASTSTPSSSLPTAGTSPSGTRGISSDLAAASSSSSSPSSTSSPSTTDAESTSAIMGTSDTMTVRERNLIIILTTTLGSLAMILMAVCICLTCRYKAGKSPFNNRRGATPIDDDEIDSWREQKLSPTLSATSPHTPRGLSIDSIALKQSPHWTWNSAHSHNGLPTSPPPVFDPTTPDFVARAPNSRVGLTDEAIPGAEPYVAPAKRQSSRLSKSPRHARTKSRRSSISGKSMRSFTSAPIVEPRSPRAPTWYDPEDEAVAAGLSDHYGSTSDTPGTSIFDGISAMGGLSPRPTQKSPLRSWEPDYAWDKETGHIGRAIA